MGIPDPECVYLIIWGLSLYYQCVHFCELYHLSFDGHSSTSTESISLYIQQDHYRETKNTDPLLKGNEKSYNKQINWIKIGAKFRYFMQWRTSNIPHWKKGYIFNYM